MGAYAQATPQLPPEIRQQQQPSPSMFMQAGAQAGAPTQPPNPVELLKVKITELEQWASDMVSLLQVVHPPSGALLVPIVQAGKALQGQIQELEARQGGTGPQEQMPPPNPAEGVQNRPIV